jgi:hypothetical protein
MYKCVHFFLDSEPDLESGLELEPRLKSRYVKNDFFGKNEVVILRRLIMLPNCSNHFHVCKSIETVKIAELGTNEYNLQTINCLKDDHSMLLRYADERLLYLDGFLRSLSCSRKYIYLLTDFYVRLLSNIHLLVSNNIVHNNIGFKTMVVNSFELPILTNFRFSLNLSVSGSKMNECLKHIFIQYNPGHIYWPPEIHLLCYILTNKLSSLSLNNVETVLSGLKIVYDNNDNYNALLKHFAKYVNMNCDQIIADIMRFSGTWDQYSLGICYLKLIGDLEKNIKTSNNFVVMFLELLQETVNALPLKRPSVSKTLAKYKQLLYDCSIADLYSLIKRF